MAAAPEGPLLIGPLQQVTLMLLGMMGMVEDAVVNLKFWGRRSPAQ